MNLIQLENLTKLYKNERGIKDINLEVQAGEIFGLLGPNGAGKTTTLKLITGLLNKNQGTVKIDNKELEEDYEEYMKQIGCIIGDAKLYPHLNAIQHMQLVANYYGDITEERREEVLEKVGLIVFAREKVKQYSTGMKQRLSFAMAIVHNPKILLLDEPFSGMDIEGKAMIRSYIKNVASNKKMAVIVSSHLIYDIEDIATRVAIMEQGMMSEAMSKKQAIEKYGCLEAYFLAATKERRENNEYVYSSC